MNLIQIVTANWGWIVTLAIIAGLILIATGRRRPRPMGDSFGRQSLHLGPDAEVFHGASEKRVGNANKQPTRRTAEASHRHHGCC
jgi:hypothetical protein